MEIIEVPFDGNVSYLNFYMANGAVVVSITDDPDQEDRPMGVVKEVFGEDYEVVGIESNLLGEGAEVSIASRNRFHKSDVQKASSRRG